MGLDLFASRRFDEYELTNEDLEAFRVIESDLCGVVYRNGLLDPNFYSQLQPGSGNLRGVEGFVLKLMMRLLKGLGRNLLLDRSKRCKRNVATSKI